MIGRVFNRFKSRLTTPKINDGKDLEALVAKILRNEGFKDIQMNVIVKDPNGHRSEIDVIARKRSLWRRFLQLSPVLPYGKGTVYVECKQYSPDSRIELEQVSKFKAVCVLNSISLSNALFVSTTSYVPRAKTIGIRTVDGDQLKKWYKQTRPSYVPHVLGALAAVFLCAFVYNLREVRLLASPPVRDFSSVSSCGRPGAVGVTYAKPEDIQLYKPFISYELHAPLPLNDTERARAHALIDASTTSVGVPALDACLRAWAHHRAGQDYMVINLPLSPAHIPRLSRSVFDSEARVMPEPTPVCLRLHAHHVLTVPAYWLGYIPYRWSTITQGVKSLVDRWLK